MGSINVALNSNATASRSVSPFLPSYAVNGDVSARSRWVSGVTIPNSNPWFMVDLRNCFYINRYVLYSMSNIAGWFDQSYSNSSFNVQVSTDGTNWTPVNTVSNNVNYSVDRILSAGYYCRYIKVNFIKGLNGNPFNASISEFQVWTLPCAQLSSLELSEDTLAPAFNAGIYNYTASVNTNTGSITILPTAQNPSVNITVNNVKENSGTVSQPINLNYGQNTITITVNDTVSMTQCIYTVVVTRPGAFLSNLVSSAGDLSPLFNINTMNYTQTVDTSVSSITLTPTACDSTGTITVNGSPVTSGVPSQAVSLNYGVTTIPVVVTDAGICNTYNVAVTRTSKYLSQLVAKDNAGNTLNFDNSFNGHTLFTYAAAVPYDVMNNGLASTQVNFTPIDDMAGETITVNGTNVASGATSANIPLTPGSVTTIPVVSTYNGNSQQYNINVTMASDPYLASVTGMPISMPSTEFNKMTYSYSGNTSMNKTMFTPVTEGTDASIKVTCGSQIFTPTSGTSVTITTNLRGTTYNIVVTVTSNKGLDSKTYNFSVKR